MNNGDPVTHEQMKAMCAALGYDSREVSEIHAFPSHVIVEGWQHLEVAQPTPFTHWHPVTP